MPRKVSKVRPQAIRNFIQIEGELKVDIEEFNIRRTKKYSTVLKVKVENNVYYPVYVVTFERQYLGLKKGTRIRAKGALRTWMHFEGTEFKESFEIIAWNIEPISN